MARSLVWIRQDLRVTDNPALVAAIKDGDVVPVYVLDEAVGNGLLGAAQRWWLHHSLRQLRRSYAKRGARLITLRGDTISSLVALAAAAGADRIHANRMIGQHGQTMENELGAAIRLDLHDGNFLVPPDRIRNGKGERYKVFTPWYRALQEMHSVAPSLPPPSHVPMPEADLPCDDIDAWSLLPTAPDWAAGFGSWRPGEAGAWRRWRAFQNVLAGYKFDRDVPSLSGTSRLSPHLHFGEISPRSLWHGLDDRSGTGSAAFRRELAWRDYGANLLDQFPDYGSRNGRAAFARFSWRSGEEADRDFRAWTRGRTGYPIVDAGMRELWLTGWMHNRVRMITASFLVKHLLIDWRRGERWFWDTLLDADEASNAMNWQYVSGSGVDAPVFSRIMAPHLQCEKFDTAAYIRRFVPELGHLRDDRIYALHRGEGAVRGYPAPMISHEAARFRALQLWQSLMDDKAATPVEDC